MDRYKVKKDAWKMTIKKFPYIYKGLIFGILIALIYSLIYTVIVKDNINMLYNTVSKTYDNLTKKDMYVSVIQSLSIYNLLIMPLSLGGTRSILAIYNFFILSKGFSWIQGSLIVVSILIIPMSYGLSRYMLLLVREDKPKLLKNIFYYYRHNILETIGLTLLISAAMFIGLQLIAFPCVFVYLISAMSKDIMVDRTTNPINIIKENYRLIKGYKWNYFNFLISFVGWMILSVLTLGIALIWVIPYMIISQKLYYEQLRKLKKIKVVNK